MVYKYENVQYYIDTKLYFYSTHTTIC